MQVGYCVLLCLRCLLVYVVVGP